MKRFIYLLSFLVLLPLAASSQTSDKILWKEDSLKIRITSIATHPNGNVLVCSSGGGLLGAGLYEINGITGKFVRYYGIMANDNIYNLSVSKDGKYFLIDPNSTQVIDYQTGYSVFGIGGSYKNSGALYPDSKRVVGCTAREKSDSSNLFIYNLETKQYEKRLSCHEITWPDAMAVSDDGNYLAIGGFFVKDPGTSGQKTSGRVILFDAHTLLPIKTFPDSSGDVTRNLRFSPDSKSLAYVKGSNLYIMSVENHNLVKQYNQVNRPTSGIVGYCYINNTTVALTSWAKSDSEWFEIDDFKSDQVLYRTNEFGSFGSQCAFNPINNSLVLTNTETSLVHYGLDLSKLITGITEGGQQNSVNIYYQNSMLNIDNIFKDSPNISVKIINLQGQLLNQYQIQPIGYNDTIQIPVALSTGSYIVQIIDGSKDYTGKMLVIE